MKNNVLRNFIAVVLMGLGAILILDNIGLIESDVTVLWHYVYPLFFIIYGVTLWWHYFKRRGEQWFFGTFLIVFGTLLILGRLDLIVFTFADILSLWPLLIIYIGFNLFGKSPKRSKSKMQIFNKGQCFNDKAEPGRFATANFEYKEPNWQVKPLNLWSAAGNYYFDFSKAFMPDEEIPIQIDSLAGDVHMIIPEQLAFKITGSVVAGEIDVLGERVEGTERNLVYGTPGYEEAVQKLDILITLQAGSIRIDRV